VEPGDSFRAVSINSPVSALPGDAKFFGDVRDRAAINDHSFDQ
jgi:hypothetical protein